MVLGLLGGLVPAEPVAAQAGRVAKDDAAFAAAFRAAHRGLERLCGTPEERRAAAHGVLEDLDAAAARIDGLAADRRGRARFFIGVTRAQVHERIGTDEASAHAGNLALATRAAAIREGAYATHYRTQLLITLWRTMGSGQFLLLIDEETPAGRDRDYLLAPATLTEVARDPSSLKWHLRLLRADIRLHRNPKWAVEELRRLAQELGDGASTAAARELRDECHSLLAWHYLELRDYTRARLFLELLPRSESRYPRALIALREEDYTVAADAAARLVAEDESAAALLLLANATEGQARDALARGERGPAAGLYHAALAAYERAVATAVEPGDLAAARNGIGDCYLGLGVGDAAARAYAGAREALSGVDSWTASAELAETLKDEGRWLERSGDGEAAVLRFEAALQEIEAVRARIPSDALGIHWLEPPQLAAVDGILRLAAAGAIPPIRALASMDRMKARGMLDWLTAPPSVGDVDSLRAALRRVARSPGAIGTREGRLLLEKTRSQVEGIRRGQPLTVAELEDLFAAHPEAIFLSYWVGKDADHRRTYVLMARAERIRVIDLGDNATAMRHHRATIAAVAGPTGDPWPALDRAAAFFFPPAVTAAFGAEVELVISLDADLGGLPVEALRVRGRPLGSSTRLSHAPSLAVFHRLQQRGAQGSRVLVFDSVHPPAEERELHDLADLDYSAAEGDMIAGAYADVVRRQRENATLEELRRVLDEAGPFGIAHISCHALEHPYLPAASLLMLGDGPVGMSTFAQQQLAGAMVVFSSCSSAGAQSDVASGEGMRGLLWGAFGAGARLVVASHWAMNQQATKDLMSVFHAHIARGVPCAEAMRRARAVLAAAENYAHPTFWAGFGVYGPSHPVVGSAVVVERSRWLYGLLGVAGVVVLWRARRRAIPRVGDRDPPSVSAGST